MGRQRDRIRVLRDMARELGALLPTYLVLQVAFGLAPAALILLTASAVGNAPLPVGALIAWLGGILVIGTVADAVSPGLRSQMEDRTKMVLQRRWMARVALWRSLRVFEEPDIIRLRSEAERATASMVTVPSSSDSLRHHSQASFHSPGLRPR